MANLFGRIPDPQHVAELVASLPVKHVPPRLLMQEAKRDVFLWDAKNIAEPNWKRGQQGIGDCVSWGAELACTCLLWQMVMRGELARDQFAEAATEAIYGGCRVEALGERSGGWDDGAAGSWAADWLRKFGVLLRLDYSQQTGNPEHDLRKYDGRDSREGKAKRWGYYGCGGKDDKGALDSVARLYPIKDVTMVRNPDESAAAIDAGCPITTASSVGFEGNRNADGIIRKRGQWPHQMCILGKKYLPSGERLHRIFNSWNSSVKGPDPGITDQAISECSWWVVDEDLERILSEEDSYAFSNVEGFTQAPYNFAENLIV